MNKLQNLQLQFLVQVQPVFRANPLFKFILVAQYAALLIGLISPLADLLVLVPISLFRLHLWRLFTNLFVETNLIVLVWSVYSFHQFVLYIQPNWPLLEIVKLAFIAQFGTLFALIICSLLLYAFLGLITPFYLAPISGTSALAMAALMALKQYIPDTVLLTTPAGRLKNGHLPFTLALLCAVLWLFGLCRGTVPFQQIFSAQISWTYLRFFQSRGGMPEPMVGDRSEHFTWASLFPRRAQSLATLCGRLTFRSLRRAGVLRRVLRTERLAQAEEDTLHADTLQSLRVVDASAAVLAPEGWDAERRRQKALRMLNERLAPTAAASATTATPAATGASAASSAAGDFHHLATALSPSDSGAAGDDQHGSGGGEFPLQMSATPPPATSSSLAGLIVDVATEDEEEQRRKWKDNSRKEEQQQMNRNG
ncbi:hypothetical protein niasHT_001946 [Heterodera trifolii]|uniref:Derlin n=1 Tax=Heterodera trifolii TaxID=157864 RepID=A0ABD2M4E0_9BILA